ATSNVVSPAALRGTDLSPPPAVALPAGSLLALGDGPAGARGGGPAVGSGPADAVAVRLPDALSGARSAEMTIVTLYEEGDRTRPPGLSGPAGMIDEFFGSLSGQGGGTIERALDSLRPLIDALL